MAESSTDRALEQLLGHRETVAADDFVTDVMARVERYRRQRRVILWGTGLLGAVFGLLGASSLADPVARLFTDLPATGTMQAVLLAVAMVAFYGWFMNEDMSLDS